jgi:hypothetical protein
MSTGPFRFLRREPGVAALAFFLATACLFSGPGAPGQASAQEATQPATAPTVSAPATGPASATAPAAGGAKIDTILQALKLSDSQADAYKVALSRKGQLDDPAALTMLLRKIASLPMLQSQEWNELDRPAVRNLLAEPQRYAGRPICLRAYVNVAWKWTPGVDFAATADWTRNDKPIYRYDCLNAEAEYPASDPLYVLSPVEPNVFLGRPIRTGDDGELIYGNPRVQLAGVFYKVYAAKDRDGRAREYPVVLAWQLRPAEGGALVTPAAESWSQALGVAIILLVGIVFYFFWRFRQAARGIRTRDLAAKNLRQAPRLEEEQKEKEEPAPEEDQADPGLAAAAAEFRKKEGSDAK